MRQDGVVTEGLIKLKLRMALWNKFVRPKKIMSVEDTLVFIRKTFRAIFVILKPSPTKE